MPLFSVLCEKLSDLTATGNFKALMENSISLIDSQLTPFGTCNPILDKTNLAWSSVSLFVLLAFGESNKGF